MKPLGIFTSHCGNLEGSYGGASRPPLRALGDMCVRDGPAKTLKLFWPSQIVNRLVVKVSLVNFYTCVKRLGFKDTLRTWRDGCEGLLLIRRSRAVVVVPTYNPSIQ